MVKESKRLLMTHLNVLAGLSNPFSANPGNRWYCQYVRMCLTCGQACKTCFQVLPKLYIEKSAICVSYRVSYTAATLLAYKDLRVRIQCEGHPLMQDCIRLMRGFLLGDNTA